MRQCANVYISTLAHCELHFRFVVGLCTIRIYIHQGSFRYRCYLVVSHCALHALIQFLHCITQVGCLHQYLGRGFLFRTAFLVQCDEYQFAFKPAVGSFFLAVLSDRKSVV